MKQCLYKNGACMHACEQPNSQWTNADFQQFWKWWFLLYMNLNNFIPSQEWMWLPIAFGNVYCTWVNIFTHYTNGKKMCAFQPCPEKVQWSYIHSQSGMYSALLAMTFTFYCSKTFYDVMLSEENDNIDFIFGTFIMYLCFNDVEPLVKAALLIRLLWINITQ